MKKLISACCLLSFWVCILSCGPKSDKPPGTGDALLGKMITDTTFQILEDTFVKSSGSIAKSISKTSYIFPFSDKLHKFCVQVNDTKDINRKYHVMITDENTGSINFFSKPITHKDGVVQLKFYPPSGSFSGQINLWQKRGLFQALNIIETEINICDLPPDVKDVFKKVSMIPLIIRQSITTTTTDRGLITVTVDER